MAFLGQLMQVYTAHMERHTVLCGLPLFHIYGCIIQGVAAFSVGYRVVLMTPSGFRSVQAMQSFWQLIARFRVKSFSTVPTVLMALADIPIADADISCLTNINSGAARRMKASPAIRSASSALTLFWLWAPVSALPQQSNSGGVKKMGRLKSRARTHLYRTRLLIR